MKYNVHLKLYEGPLDLLYDLISKKKIDIKDISINDITKQYIDYLSLLEKMDLEITSEFLSMATKLLEIKSRYLLFKDRVSEEDPRLELVKKLEEYKKYKLASEYLRENINYTGEVFYRTKEEIVEEEKLDLSKISLNEIEKLLPFIFKIEKEEILKDEKLDKITKEKVISIEEKINYIRDFIKKAKTFSFSELIKDNAKNEVIVTFLSLLELIRIKEVKITQEKFLGEILIIKNLEN